MVWAIVILSVALVGVLVRVFVINARAIRRDVDQRFERVQAELEERANAVVDELFAGDEGKEA